MLWLHNLSDTEDRRSEDWRSSMFGWFAWSRHSKHLKTCLWSIRFFGVEHKCLGNSWLAGQWQWDHSDCKSRLGLLKCWVLHRRFNPMVPNLLQDSEHDVTESESNRTEDSMLDRTIETKFPLDISRVQPLATETTDNSKSLFHQSMLKTSQIGERHEKDLSQVIPCPTPVMNRDLGKCSEEIDGACLKITRTERDVEAGNELWLDAHQFLAGEEDEGAIFDKWGRSCSPSPTLTHPDKTKASDYSRRENISIDHHTEDWELRFPPVERWSSSDSWASALSDWFQAVNTYSEDSFTSANTLSTGPKHGMAIQDNILEQRTSPDNANNTGQTCLNLLEPEEPGQALSRGLVESDNTNGTLFKQADKDGLPSHSDSGRQDNTTMENNMSLLERSESNKPDAPMHVLNASRSPENEASANLWNSQIPGELWSTKVRWLAHFKYN